MVMLNFFRRMSLAFSRRMWIEMLLSRWSVLRTLQGTMHRLRTAIQKAFFKNLQDLLYVIICTFFLFCRLHHAVLRVVLRVWCCDTVILPFFGQKQPAQAMHNDHIQMESPFKLTKPWEHLKYRASNDTQGKCGHMLTLRASTSRATSSARTMSDVTRLKS